MAQRSKRGRKSNLRRYDTAALVAERERRRTELEHRRMEVLATLDKIDEAIAALGGSPRPAASKPGRKKARRKKQAGGRRRGRGGTSLADAVAAALASGAHSVPDLIAAIRKAGYRSSSPNLRSMVAQRLSKDGRFKRVSRGVYALK